MSNNNNKTNKRSHEEKNNSVESINHNGKRVKTQFSSQELVLSSIKRQLQSIPPSLSDNDQKVEFEKLLEKFFERTKNIFEEDEKKSNNEREQLLKAIEQYKNEETEWNDMIEEAKQPILINMTSNSNNESLDEEMEKVAPTISGGLKNYTNAVQNLKVMTSKLSQEISSLRQDAQQMNTFFETFAEQIHAITHSKQADPKLLIKTLNPLPIPK
eukprot:c15031_g1_i1.p1 GENE.c15031_g1_i1~~c15031_g1_i1.p1  ORF type:complete len:214 (+),score=79.80 c15031_g1_i1:24-665(+)